MAQGDAEDTSTLGRQLLIAVLVLLIRFYQKYGDIIRVAPDEISVAKGEGWNDIYGYQLGHKVSTKDLIWWGRSRGRPQSIISAITEADHEHMRKLLNPTFSTRALNAQEPLIQSYIDLLMTRLRERAASKEGPTAKGEVDIVQWFNFTIFNIVGDLGFGELLN